MPVTRILIYMQNIGIVGAGTMGRAAAGKIIDAGLSLAAFDPYSPSAAIVEQLGATLATSPAAVAEQSQVILLFLPGPVQIEEAVAGTSGILSGISENSVIVDLSTTDPESTCKLAGLAASQNVGYLDAPVLGRPTSIGKWALPVGGEKRYLEKCRLVLNLLAKEIIPIGASGSGNKVKLLNQLMFGAINAMTAEMMPIAQKVGISPALLYNAITTSEAGTVSNLFRELGKCVAEDDYSNPTFSVDLLCKDVSLAVQLATREGAPPVLAQSVVAINKIAQEQGFGGIDTSIMWKCFDSVWAGESANK